MGAAGLGGKRGRAVDAADAETLQVGHDRLRRAERERGVDLQPVGADRDEAWAIHHVRPARVPSASARAA